MRLDKFLSVINIFKSRSLSAEAISSEMVKVNNQTAKASKEIGVNSIIEIDTPKFYKKIKVVALPVHNISKKNASSLFMVIEERIKD